MYLQIKNLCFTRFERKTKYIVDSTGTLFVEEKELYEKCFIFER